jgi:hypothetical protein
MPKFALKGIDTARHSVTFLHETDGGEPWQLQPQKSLARKNLRPSSDKYSQSAVRRAG